MSKLEVAVRPFLEPMMHDKPVSLDAAQQRTLALWAMKTAMVAEATKPDGVARFYTEEDRQKLRTQSVIPDYTMIWIGRSSVPARTVLGTEVWFNETEVSKAGHGCVSTIIVGHLAIQVLTVRFATESVDEKTRVICKDGPWNELLASVSPSAGTVAWPPPLSFTNDGGALTLDRLQGRWKLGTER